MDRLQCSAASPTAHASRLRIVGCRVVNAESASEIERWPSRSLGQVTCCRGQEPVLAIKANNFAAHNQFCIVLICENGGGGGWRGSEWIAYKKIGPNGYRETRRSSIFPAGFAARQGD
ncbi:hypothetical protein Trydic_g1558 [Trypoxylus dichotomus]